MKKPEKKRIPNRSLRAVRDVLGVTQAELADMLGVSARTVQAIEMGVNQMTEKFNLRLYDVTGASLRKVKVKPVEFYNDGYVWGRRGQYTLRDYNEHRETFASTRQNAQAVIMDDMQDLQKLFFAAIEQIKEERLPIATLRRSLQEWMGEQVRCLKLKVEFEEKGFDEFDTPATQKGAK
jgi:DNA-binding XRE family transcriptional regulator